MYTQRLLAGLAAAGRGDVAARLGEGLEARLEELVRRGSEAWPRVGIEPAQFLAHIARHLPEEEPARYLELVHAEDLYLALGCLLWNAAALEELERAYLSQIPPTIARMGAAGVSIDEITQRLRDRFIVGEGGGRGKIAEYSGRGSLLSWVRSAAVRETIDLARAENALKKDDSSELSQMAAAAASPELLLLRQRYAERFQAALKAALDGLPSRERNVLRFSYIDGLSIDEIAAFYRVHRATAARWIANARELILAKTRHLVLAEGWLKESEVDSLLALVASQLELSLPGLMRAESGA